MTDTRINPVTPETSNHEIQSDIIMSEDFINDIAETCSLRDVCYEEITPRYWYALFGELRVIVDTETGCFNATKLCSDGGKKFKHWLDNKHSKDLMKDLNETLADTNAIESYVVYGKQITSGTYVREELILSIASWISSSFYIKIYNITKCYFIQQFAKSNNHKNEEPKKKINEIQRQRDQLEREKNNTEKKSDSKSA